MRPPARGSARTAAEQVPMPVPDSAYWAFYEQVAHRQLADWLPAEPQRVLDLSGMRTVFAAALAAVGHDVVHVRAYYGDVNYGDVNYGDSEPAGSQHPPAAGDGPGRVRCVVADGRQLDWLADNVVDAVLAESRILSTCLAAETTVQDLARVLRPGGRVLLCVESLLFGLSRLAEMGRWAELADVPAADVVLVPAADGTITRCFWPTELRALLEDAGFDVEWVRPRTVLSPAAVERALSGGPDALPALVNSELGLCREREGESIGIHLLASARWSGPATAALPRPR